MDKKNILVTGRPGIGKTTCVRRVAELLISRGARVGGMITVEVRERGRRVGFQIIDLQRGLRGWLARVGAPGDIRVGKYTVLLDDLERIGVSAIRDALETSHVVVIDEIGPMELYSEEFKMAVRDALESSKPLLATIHARAERFEFGREILRRKDIDIVTLTIENRENAPALIARKIANLLSEKDRKF